MSRQVSPSTDQVYGLQRVTRIWGVSRATIYRESRRPVQCLRDVVSPTAWAFDTEHDSGGGRDHDSQSSAAVPRTDMKDIVPRSPGGLDRLKLVDLPDPGDPALGEIRVRLHASSLNYCDHAAVTGGVWTSGNRGRRRGYGGNLSLAREREPNESSRRSSCPCSLVWMFPSA